MMRQLFSFGRTKGPGSFSNTAEVTRTETMLATARVAMAVASLLAIYLQQTNSKANAGWAYIVLTIYVCLSFGFLIWPRRQTVGVQMVAVLHAIESVSVVLISAFVLGLTFETFI